MFWTLVALRLRVLWNAVWKVGWKYRLLGLLATFGIGTFFVTIFVFGLHIFKALAAQQTWGPLVSEIALLFGFSGVLLFFFISTAASAAGTLFLSKDLEFLFALPIKARTVFAAKLTEALLIAFAFIPFLFLPFLIAYGIGYGAPFYYYFAVLLILAALLVWGACFGLFIAGFLVRILPAGRANEIITAATSLIAVVFAFSFQMLAGRFDDRSPTEWAKIENWQPLLDLGKKLTEGPLNYLPSGWAKSALLWAGGQSSSGGALFLLLTGSAAFLFTAVVFSAEKVHERGWLLAHPKAKRKAAAVEKATVVEEKLFSPFWGVVKKDWQMLRRDFNQIITALIMPAVLVVIPLTMSARGREAVDFGKMLPFFVTGLAGMVALQNGLRALPWERLAMSQILASPLPRPTFAGSKFFFASLCTVVELWAAVALLSFFFPLGLKNIFLAFWLALFIAASAGAIGLYIGTVFARWDWDKPNQMVTPGGAFALVLVFILFGGLWAALLSAGFLAQKFIPFPLVLALASIIYGAVSYFIVWLFIRLTVKRLENLEWKF